VGYYNIAAALTLAISTMLISGAGDIALTATSMMVQKGEPDQLHRAWRFRIKASLILTVPLMVFAFAIAPTLVATLLSEAYLPAAEVFRVAIAGQILMSLLGGGAHGDILLTSGHHKTVRTLRIGFGVVNVVLNLMLIPVWGAIGAAAATAVAAVGLVVSEFIALRKKQPVILPGRVMISMFAASAAASAVVLWSSLSGWAFLATATLEFIAVFSLLAWMLKPFDAEDVPIFRRARFPADRMSRFLCRHS
jgi:O-antigen/teichoic acid export membrane protein